LVTWVEVIVADSSSDDFATVDGHTKSLSDAGYGKFAFSTAVEHYNDEPSNVPDFSFKLEPWYHGKFPRSGVERLFSILQLQTGDYLLWDSETLVSCIGYLSCSHQSSPFCCLL